MFKGIFRTAISLAGCVFVSGAAFAHGVIDGAGYLSYDHAHISAVPGWYAPDAHHGYQRPCSNPCYSGYVFQSPSYYSSYGYYGQPTQQFSYSLQPPTVSAPPGYGAPGNLPDPFLNVGEEVCAECRNSLASTRMSLESAAYKLRSVSIAGQQLKYRNRELELQNEELRRRLSQTANLD